MKKIFSFLTALIISSAVVASAFAADYEMAEFEIEKASIMISAPTSCAVFTQEVSSLDTNVTALGWTAESLTAYFKQNNIYLNVIPTGIEWEIVLTVIPQTTENPTESFARCSLKELQTFANDMISQTDSEEKGLVYSSGEIHREYAIPFCVFTATTTVDGVTTNIKQYFTINDSQCVSLTLRTINPATEEQLTYIEDMVKSVRLTNQTFYLSEEMIIVVVACAAAAVVAIIILIIVIIVVKRHKKISQSQEVIRLLNLTSSMNQPEIPDPFQNDTEKKKADPTQEERPIPVMDNDRPIPTFSDMPSPTVQEVSSESSSGVPEIVPPRREVKPESATEVNPAESVLPYAEIKPIVAEPVTPDNDWSISPSEYVTPFPTASSVPEIQPVSHAEDDFSSLMMDSVSAYETSENDNTANIPVSFSIDRAGNTENPTIITCIKRDIGRVVLIRTEKTGLLSEETAEKYIIADDALDKINDIWEKYAMSGWDSVIQLPYDAQRIVTTYTVEYGNLNRNSFADDISLSKENESGINELASLIEELMKNGVKEEV